MAKTLHLYAGDSDPTYAVGTVGLLCEFAPDSPCLKAAEHYYGPDKMLGSVDAALPVAYALVSKLFQSSPIIDGLPVLKVFEELLLEQVSYIAQAFHLDRWIRAQSFEECKFVSYSPWLDRLLQVRKVTGSRYTVVADVPILQSHRGGRALRKLWDSRPTPAEFLHRALPLWSRRVSAAGKWKQAQDAPRGGIWFYSLAYNFTKIGLLYEPFFPQKMNFLVEDPRTGGKRLREVGRKSHWLYAWSRTSDIPSLGETRSIGRRIIEALAAAALTADEDALRTVMLNSEWWSHLLTRRLPFVLFNNRVLQRWREAVRPETIVVGNAGDERVLLLREDAERVPTVLLQHGIMHWTYAVTDEPVDVFVLRGAFFQRSVNENFRRKTVVHNFAERNFPEANAAVSQQENVACKDILFITAPYDVPPLYHRKDLVDILRSLLRVAHSTRRRLTIRVHPNETIPAYRQAVEELQREAGLQAEVAYSQGPGVEAVLARSCVAVLHFSTMFLDCLRHSIPIVSFGWHGFPNKRQFEDEGIFHFAANLGRLETLVGEGIEGRLPQQSARLEDFLAPSRPQEVSKFFQEIWDARGAALEIPH
ncbi:MAG TPA: hypothetical protein VGM18_18365 [Candidatus Sulfotelmatobacter sp.]|jgi:hypothetical protein